MSTISTGDWFDQHLDDVFFAGLIHASTETYVVIDLDGMIRWASPQANDLLGSGPDAYLGRNIVDFLAPDSVAPALQVFEQYTRPGRVDTGWIGPPMPLELVLRPGETTAAEVRIVPTNDPTFPGAVIALDIHAPESALYGAVEMVIADQPLEMVMDSILRLVALESPLSIPVIGWGWDGCRFNATVASPLAPLFDGYPLPVDLPGPTPWGHRLEMGAPIADENMEFIDPAVASVASSAGLHACWVFPVALSRERGPEAALVLWRKAPGPPLLNLARRLERITGIITLALGAHMSRQHLHTAARTDAVTGLLNRTALAERLAELDRTPSTATVAVIYCDLDYFKRVNDEHGHVIGDKALVVATERIRARVRGNDLVARVGGDEFIVVTSVDSPEEVQVLCERLLRAFDDPISVGGATASLGISLGVAIASPKELGTTVTGQQLVERADAALIRAKTLGKNRFEVG